MFRRLHFEDEPSIEAVASEGPIVLHIGLPSLSNISKYQL